MYNFLAFQVDGSHEINIRKTTFDVSPQKIL